MSQQIPERIPGGGIDLSHLAARGQAAAQPGGPAAAGAGGAPDARVVDVPSLVMDVTDASFEQAAQLSTVVPVVVELWAAWSEPNAELSPVLEKVTREFGGRVLLARVDADANPGLVQAFQAQAIPTVVALVAGRPVPLFQGAQPEEQVRDVFTQLLQLAEQHGVVGRVAAPDQDATAADAAPSEPEIPAAHVAAVEAAERGDFAGAVAEWEAVLAKAPADAVARAALVQMRLLQRLSGVSAEEVRAAAAAAPQGIAEQLAVADLDVSGGHVEDAFLRLLDLFAASDEDARAVVRERLLELFEVVGVADPRVIAARGRLANLLY
ncbi:tetratricopeptide repeat protein [Leucobacter luti]|uniref:Putative thioredoxin n=1 Tax=Leucobacter luti TaxID=340320 RepID=A0A4Q7TUQ3_9MICO|nr:tetratricopeptide repeat protein [Leucobacter luti]MBL3698241.1 co-chaperone YbbN [Leucobacter luti]RZT64676.1 putative thioredoxin [Leucobacter luti]